MNDSATNDPSPELAASSHGHGLAERSRSVGLVPFVFGIAGRTELPGVVLNRLLIDLGLTPAAAKTMLARMRNRGQLAAQRTGRGSRYRLAGPFERSFQRIRAGHTAAPIIWPGWFHTLLYQVPEAERPFRDLLRRHALLVGYGMLQQGLLIATADHTEALAVTLARRPASAIVYHAELRLSVDDARTAAAQAWALADVDEVLRRHCVALEAALAEVPSRSEPTAQTLRRLAEIVNAPLIDTLLAPNLPPELLPTDWPMATLHRLIGKAHEHYLPPARAYVEQLLAPHDL